MTVIAECRYCGQAHMIDVPEHSTQDEREEMAAWECPCEGARSYREKEICKRDTLQNIEDLFEDRYPEVQEVLKTAVPLIADGAFRKVVIDTGKRIKVTLARQKSGTMKLEKHYNEVESLES